MRNADVDIAKTRERWLARADRDIVKLSKRIEAETKEKTDEIIGHIPLDKRRLRSEFAKTSLSKAMNTFLNSLDRQKILRLLKQEVQRFLPALQKQGGAVQVQAFGLEQDELDGLLKAISLPIEKTSLEANISPWPALLILANGIRFRTSIEEIAQGFMSEKRAELATALLGEEVLND